MNRIQYHYWILTLIAGVYIILNKDAFQSKFQLKYPENIYIGSLMITVSVVIILLKFFFFQKNKKKSSKDSVDLPPPKKKNRG